MSEFYDEAAADVLDAIEEFGRSMRLVTTTSSGPDWDPTLVETEVDVMGIAATYSILERQGSLIAAGDRKYLFGATAPITSDMSIRDEGQTLGIVNVDPIKPGDTLIGYRVQVRG